MGYQTAPHGSLGLPGGLYQSMALTEGAALPFESKWVLYPPLAHGATTEAQCIQYLKFVFLEI